MSTKKITLDEFLLEKATNCVKWLKTVDCIKDNDSIKNELEKFLDVNWIKIYCFENWNGWCRDQHLVLDQMFREAGLNQNEFKKDELEKMHQYLGCFMFSVNEGRK